MKKKNKIFLFILIIIIIPALILKSPISMVPLIFVSLSILISFIYLLLIRNSLEIIIDDTGENRFERLSSSEYNIKIKNNSYLIFPRIELSLELDSIEGYNIEKYEYQFILNSKEMKKMYVNVEFPHIGKYIVNIKEIKIFDIFNLFHIKSRPKWRQELLITPKTYDIDKYSIKTSNPIFNVDYNVPYKIDGDEYDDIREYEPGDSMKNIHWKLSAHTDKYMTRIMTTDAISGVSIYLDFNLEKRMSFIDAANINDTMIESAYSLSQYIIDEEYGINYVYSDYNNPVNKYPKDYLELDSIINNLPRVSNIENINIEILLSEYSKSNLSFDNIIIFTSYINNNLIQIIHNLIDNRKFPILFRIGIDNIYDMTSEEKILIEKSKVNYYMINSAKELSHIIGGID